MSGFALAAVMSALCTGQLEEPYYWEPWPWDGPADTWNWRPIPGSRQAVPGERGPLPKIRTIEKRPAAPPTPGKFYGPGTAVRQDISTLAADSPTLQSYRKAIAAMKALPPTDPHNWTFQANIHGFPPESNPDPNWGHCQHGNWWFLPWHRAYLHYFERIARKYAEDPSFALPYWDYSNPQARTLPAAFRDQSSALYDSTRRLLVNNGIDRLNEALVIDNFNRAMASTVFADSGNVTTFGGQLLSAPQHLGSPHGALEAPHDLVHGFVGGNMGDVNTAPRDPIFYLHHANVDRLWVAWLQMGQGRANPSNDVWLNQQFTFYDENKEKVTIPMRQVQEIAALGYSYDRTPAPPQVPTTPASQTQVQTIAAWQTQGIPLLNTPATMALTIPDLSTFKTRKAERRLHLQVSEFKFAGLPDSTVEVYVNLPPRTPIPGPKSPYCAGCFTFFDHDHDGKGLVSRVEVTQHLQKLLEAAPAGPRQITVTLVRVSPGVVPQSYLYPCTFNLLTLSATK